MAENEDTARAIDAYWLGRFMGLAEGSRVLDIATGNGAVLSLAARAAEHAGRTFALTGIDAADIRPLRYLRCPPPGLREARFLGGVVAENLPLPDAAFDVVTSQYGLEYTDLAKSLAEVVRVLVPGGRLLWLAHTEDSLVVQQNRNQSAQVTFLLGRGSPLHAMRRFVAITRRGGGLRRAVKELRASLARAEQYCNEHPSAGIVREVCTVIADSAQRWQAFRPDDLDHMIADSQARLSAHRYRINDMLNAVLTVERRAAIQDQLRPPFWESAQFSEFRVGTASSLIGLRIEAVRADGDDVRTS